MKKIWLRLGGYIECTAEQAEKIQDGDSETLVKAIKDNGVELNGETYIPETETEFELNPIKLTFFR